MRVFKRTTLVSLHLLRIFGCFPYRWNFSQGGGKLEISFSICWGAWSALVIIGMCSLSIKNIVFSQLGSLGSRKTAEILSEIIATSYNSLVTIMFVYLNIRSPCLAKILRAVCDLNISIKKNILGVDDALLLISFLGFLAASFCSLAFSMARRSVQDIGLLVINTVSKYAERFSDLAIFTFLLVAYLLVKVVSIEMENTVSSLGTTCLTKAWSLRPWTTGNVTGKIPEEKMDHSASSVTKFSISGAPASHLLKLGDVVQNITDYIGLPVALLLLNTIFATTAFLYKAITFGSVYYIMYLAIPFFRMIQIILIPDHLIRKVENVERVLAQGPSVSICRLFTLDRGILLTVASNVTTYLIITLQFQVSEEPGLQHTKSNCTSVS
ncbi:uncharacterized protein [Macrobrachium rosenbergii]|uniref:uncharacterized protein n=1 Tax=Macrobrachium rosenbergii TaxID=79674 RepID=UPI0034D7063B